MEMFARTRKKCRICKKRVKETGCLFRCTNCDSSFWHRAVLSQNLNDPEILNRTLQEAEVPSMLPGKAHFFVYAIKLTGSPANSVYVGMTGLHPHHRYLNHIRGHKASSVVKKRALALINFEGPVSYSEASRREISLAQELEHVFDKVYGGH